MTKIAELEDFVDSNVEQEVRLPDSPSNCKYLKITFNGSTDFFGRITIYNLKVFGSFTD
jgi:hypothetical protein